MATGAEWGILNQKPTPLTRWFSVFEIRLSNFAFQISIPSRAAGHKSENMG
jgi:hypothetical protein